MAEQDEFRKCVEKCPDKSKLIIVNNWSNENVKEQCLELEKQGAKVHWHPENIGCGPAMNIGLRAIGEEWLDYVIILSPAALFTNSIQDFVDMIEEREKTEKNYYYMTIGTYLTDLHAFAITKRCVEEVGLYDENFYPVYFDDTDYGYRMSLIGAQKTIVKPDRICQGLGMGVSKDPRIFKHYWANAPHIADYYIRKWGGEHTHETFKTPFNDPTKSIKDWVREEDKMIKLNQI
jgi:glycosyltransferase involved in cell wall biosynthesis